MSILLRTPPFDHRTLVHFLFAIEEKSFSSRTIHLRIFSGSFLILPLEIFVNCLSLRYPWCMSLSSLRTHKPSPHPSLRSLEASNIENLRIFLFSTWVTTCSFRYEISSYIFRKKYDCLSSSAFLMYIFRQISEMYIFNDERKADICRDDFFPEASGERDCFVSRLSRHCCITWLFYSSPFFNMSSLFPVVNSFPMSVR